MGWCEECSRYWKPAVLDEEGACPTCGTVIGPAPKAPWHFKLLVVAVVLYLGLRAWQGVAWLIGRL
ncbi:MAG: hypothetical protein LC733_02085 [Actinobacteria bacterium]|nr:hypothetical protein [Actinomycetota bacterium]